jgi:hypothetical protein
LYPFTIYEREREREREREIIWRVNKKEKNVLEALEM